MKKTYLFSGLKKFLGISFLTQASAGHASLPQADNVCADLANGASQEALHQILQNEFQSLHRVKLDWNEILEVSDDKEGSSCLFTNHSGNTVVVPVHRIQYAVPNKYSK